MPRVTHLPATGVYCYFTVFYQTAGKQMSFKLWYTGDAPPGTNYNADTAATAIYNHIKSGMLGMFDTQCTVQGAKLSVRNGLLEFSGQTVTNDVGLTSGVLLPDELNAVLRRITDFPGPEGRGRLRLAGMSDSFVAGNYLTASAISAYVAFATLCKSTVTDQGIVWSPANFSNKAGALHAMLDMIADTKIGTDRRRRVRF